MDYSELAMMADDAGVSTLTEPEKGMLDRERTDLLDKGDMLKIFRYILDKPLPKEDVRADLFSASIGKGVATTFLRDEDDTSILAKFDISGLLYTMDFPRSEKTPRDLIVMNELRTLVLSNVRKSQGFVNNRVNLLTLMSTIFKHNIHTMTDQGQRPGFMGGIGRIFGKM